MLDIVLKLFIYFSVVFSDCLFLSGNVVLFVCWINFIFFVIYWVLKLVIFLFFIMVKDSIFVIKRNIIVEIGYFCLMFLFIEYVFVIYLLFFNLNFGLL